MQGITELRKTFEESKEFTQMPPIHPGEILLEEFMKPTGLNSHKLEKLLKVPKNRIARVVSGQTSLCTDTCLRLAKFFGTTYQLWTNLQTSYEVAILLPNITSQLDEISTIDTENTK